MTRSSSHEEDERRAEVKKGRVDTTHGGQLVEAIAPEEIELINEPDCKHERLIRDETETEFQAFTCANAKCGVVVLFNKE